MIACAEKASPPYLIAFFVLYFSNVSRISGYKHKIYVVVFSGQIFPNLILHEVVECPLTRRISYCISLFPISEQRDLFQVH